MTANPLLAQLLAPELPTFRVGSAAASRCPECGGPAEPAADGLAPCPICRLGWIAAWEPGRVRLALIPELAQGPLNALVVRLTLALMAAARSAAAGAGRPPKPAPDGARAAEAARQNRLLAALQGRVAATRAALPFAASPLVLRQTLLALPASRRAALVAELEGLRYLPEPGDPEVARWFRRRLALAPPDPPSCGLRAPE